MSAPRKQKKLESLKPPCAVFTIDSDKNVGRVVQPPFHGAGATEFEVEEAQLGPETVLDESLRDDPVVVLPGHWR